VQSVIKPPDWRNQVGKDPARFVELLQSSTIKALIQSANERYMHWDEFRHRPMPAEITHEMGWACVRLSRAAQVREIPLLSTKGGRFSYWLPDSILRELHFIDQHATGQILVDEPVFSSADREKYVINSLMEEAIASSILEGAATTRKKAKELLREGRAPRSRGEQMIINNYRVMSRIKELASNKLSSGMVLELQAELTRDTLEDSDAVGRFRRNDEDIKVVDMTTGEILHVPPPAEELHDRMELLCRFANEEPSDAFIHPVTRGIILHFWLAYDHPFVDGNGRTARALFYWYLMKRGYWLMAYLPVSRLFLRAPVKYKKAFLYTETDGDDLTYFIHFNVRAMRIAVEDLKRYLARKQQELRETSTLLRNIKGLNHRQRDILRHALAHPDADYTIQRHMITHGVVYQTARTDLLGLVRRGLLTLDRRAGTMHFSPHENLRTRVRITKV
jgi:Fic family protein